MSNFANLLRDAPLGAGTRRRGRRGFADLAIERLSTRAAISLLTGPPPLQAEVILLRVLAGLDYEAVARLLERSPGVVRVAAHRGLRRLAEILAEAGVTL
jgi:RNA polymerase sigma-70 factor, ECF subfamily